MKVLLRKFVKRDGDKFPVVKINIANREKRFALFHKVKRPFFIITIYLGIFWFCTLLALTVLLSNPEICSAERSFGPQLHVVKRGETLSGIALRYGVSIAQLRRWNGLRGDNILEGQHLQLWRKSTAKYYVVRAGDTLSEIAESYGVSISLLRRLKRNPAAVKVIVEVRNLAYTDAAWAIRFEQLRYRDAEKIVKGVLTYARRHTG